MPLVKVNNNYITEDYRISEGDDITIHQIETVGQLLEAFNIESTHRLITIAFEEVSLDEVLKDGDMILITDLSKTDKPVDQDKESTKIYRGSVSHTEKIKLNSEEVGLSAQNIKDEDLVILVNDKTIILPKHSSEYTFANIFDFIEFDLSTPKGTVQLIRNGKLGALTDVLHNGDQLKIFWKK